MILASGTSGISCNISSPRLAGEAAAQQLRGQLHARDCDAAALRARAEGAEQARAAEQCMLQVRDEAALQLSLQASLHHTTQASCCGGGLKI